MQSPALGYNNNVRHKGQVFHIQTEDSGVKHPHVMTHLFADGGRILKTLKTSYRELLSSDSLQEIVRQLMKKQHKAMFVALRDGEFDHLLSGSVPPSAAPPSGVPSSMPPSSLLGMEALSGADLPSESALSAGNGRPAIARGDEACSLPVTAETATTVSPPVFLAAPPLPREMIEQTAQLIARAPELEASPSGAPPASVDPPPPASGEGTARDSTKPLRDSQGPGRGKRRSNRYGSARPAKIFSSAPAARSIFGEDLLQEKSLDDVILHYLSEDEKKSSRTK